ncbi:MAG: uroporphyrinogen-III C-methyltransferase [Gammaproteobacteria bacterium]|nr:uroporphyrinogen-III C-methyltransferase [Gammaproteobacteria bacterium]
MTQEGAAVSDTPATNDQKENKTHSTTKHKRKKTSHHTNHHWILWLVLVVLIGLSYQFGWKNIQEFHDRFVGMETAMQGVREDTAKQLDEFKTGISAIDDRQSHLENGLDEWFSKNSHLRKDWLLAEAEYLIKLASHRLLLEQDVKTAIVAMEGANARLADVGDPSLLKVRKQINKDIQKLKSVPTIDVAGISLTLSGLIQSVNKLPLQVPDPDSIRQRIKERTPEKREVTGVKSFLTALWQDLKNLVIIRSHDSPVQHMLTADQQFFLVQNLQLRLEQARLALLQGETGVYQERLKEMEQWVPQYFDTTHELTKSTLGTLVSLRKQDITPELPELTRSYEMLEKYLTGGSTYKPRKAKKKVAEEKPKGSKDSEPAKPDTKAVPAPEAEPAPPKQEAPAKPEASTTPQVKI